MEVHHWDVQLALGPLQFPEGAPAHQQAGHEEERVHAEGSVLDEHGVGCLHPGVELVLVDVRQVVEGHVAMSEDHPHHTEASQSVQAVDYIGIVHLLDGEDLGGVVEDGEGQKQGFLGSCLRVIFNIWMVLNGP